MKPNRLAITICATKSYCYALTAQVRRIQAAISHLPKEEVVVIYSGDNSPEFDKAYRECRQILQYPEFHKIDGGDLEGKYENYKEQAQLLIAQLRTAAFSKARTLRVDRCWSLDSDVLPPSHALKCMEQMLDFDDGYYSVSTCTYPSQGGGGFLGGRGTPHRQILPDVYDDERKMPAEVQAKMKEIRDFLAQTRNPKEIKPEEQVEIEARIKEIQQLEKDAEKYEPIGNIWVLNSKGWRPRGWMDNAYPAIGKGAVLPTDWCGFGCTLMNKKALDLAVFDGYEGKGTEDLFIVWNRWNQRDLKINVITHCLCDHVIRDKNVPLKYILCQSYHETEGDCKGHIRMRYRPFYSQDLGEKYSSANDGILNRPNSGS